MFNQFEGYVRGDATCCQFGERRDFCVKREKRRKCLRGIVNKKKFNYRNKSIKRGLRERETNTLHMAQTTVTYLSYYHIIFIILLDSL